MKNKLLIFVTFFFAFTGLKAQDIILKTDGEEINATVTEITLTDVVYKHPDSLQSLPQTLPKHAVFMIKYANGTKEIISQTSSGLPRGMEPTPENMYELGRSDARKYYKGNAVMWGSAAASVLVPYGYIVPIVIALNKPKIGLNDIPDANLLQNQDYMRGYQKQAHNRKIGKAATGMGIGTGAALVVSAIMIFVIFSTWN
ncbi:hypothetical protein [Adhaeribacter aquaticus]|uniref:hypothetical protein n=1 Tax=Adhaeribacter aquaticus TaxID=299567 RepID=UPI0005518ECC|nr:hypothetical protein [Adhaeribacter aquaticus]